MKYRSTRGGAAAVPFSTAIRQGLAPDGGLYVPEILPHLELTAFAAPDGPASVAVPLLAPHCAGDALAAELPAIVADAFNFPAPLVADPEDPAGPSVLELFHGPTAAFKDFGARFLAACLQRLPNPDGRPLTVLVATSGDTGGAVAAAFHRRPGFRVVLLYPLGGVSALQERQLCCWDDNVATFAVHGGFDDCQRLVKEAFADPALRDSFALSSANSINVGRLLPQLAAFAAASLQLRAERGGDASFVVPSGNLGHAVACLWAREMGLPIGDVVLAHNANRAVPDFFADGNWRPRPSVATIANAMDVGDPSNMERLRALYPDRSAMTTRLSAVSIDDDAIRERIRAEHRRSGRAFCPHTAVAAEAWHRLPGAVRERGRWVIVATAHPAKFPETVEPLVGRRVEPPASLADLLSRPTNRREIAADITALRQALAAA